MKMFKMFFALCFLTASATTHAAPITVNMDGAALTSNGETYFIDPTVWNAELRTNTPGLPEIIISENPEIVGYPNAVNSFNIRILLVGLYNDNTYTTGDVIGTQYLTYTGPSGIESSIPNTNFGFQFGYTSGSWDWVDYDLIFNLDYEVPIDPFNLALGSNNYGSYSFTVENYFETSNPSPVPVPAAVWLFGAGLLGLVGVARRKTYPVA